MKRARPALPGAQRTSRRRTLVASGGRRSLSRAARGTDRAGPRERSKPAGTTPAASPFCPRPINMSIFFERGWKPAVWRPIDGMWRARSARRSPLGFLTRHPPPCGERARDYPPGAATTRGQRDGRRPRDTITDRRGGPPSRWARAFSPAEPRRAARIPRSSSRARASSAGGSHDRRWRGCVRSHAP